jgi:hypothetical protein
VSVVAIHAHDEVTWDRHLDGVLDQIAYRFSEPSVVSVCDDMEGVDLPELVEHISSSVGTAVVTNDDPQLVTKRLSNVCEFWYQTRQRVDFVVCREHDDDHVVLVGPLLA